MRLIHNVVGRRALALTGLALLAGFGSACNTSRLLDVTTPDKVPVSLLDDPSNAVLMVNSLVGDYQCALGSAIVVEALNAGEMNDAQLGAAQWDYARRTENTATNGIYGTSGCAGTQGFGIYMPLSTARYDADHAINNLTTWTDAQVPNRKALLSIADLYAGFSYAMLGMSMCQAAFDNGPAVNQAGMFALAEQRFTDAITNAQAAGVDSVRFAALVGRARVRLFQGNTAGALADAQQVPAGFVMNATTSATALRLYNRVYAVTKQYGYYSIPSWSQNMTTENGEVDPRSATELSNVRSANNNATIIYDAVKYSAGDAAPIPMARYAEAQLIIAEIQGGAQAVTIINTMRAAVGLKPYVGPVDAASIKNLVIDERKRVLFLEGFRNYDLERFNIPYYPPAGDPFPVGGGTYGNTTCLPLPDVEKNNNP
ncbi:MAG TPA: RagB/SusD family nutrient uptake outer membrane protein, partial [Gemmatimonadaceae bacterium]